MTKMITTEQKKWIDHLSDNPGEIKIVPYDPKSNEIFRKLKTHIQSQISKLVKVEHRGASSLGISGQDEIDAYIPVSPKLYLRTVDSITGLFGNPRSHYPLQRTRFRVKIDGKRIDLFVINKESPDWLNGLKFENYLISHPKDLEKYKKLKEKNSGISSREYYKRKIKFINIILTKAN